MQQILANIELKYQPLSSYSNGTNSAHCDFNCMLIVQRKELSHDGSIVAGVQLDLFLYTAEEVADCFPI
ncbi:hypothetical protein PAECIP111802_06905 [Paenibacillus allorhizosphaerae]|uniref:Uncharacterized protein n=1 Tax=Paenibacillus allorhizosphaerae TaxID=2849866 RepID=A0ABN7TW41_9BACL|nr:hypothetical protein PAECIP111802_06905 [Paenibacillus allorhizosphaerae]